MRRRDKIIQGTVQGKRKTGRHIINYMNNLGNWTEMTNIEIFRTCEDTHDWRIIRQTMASAATIDNDDDDR